MFKRIFSWFIGTDAANVEPFYRSREVWTYQHIDPQTKRVSTKPVLIFRKAGDGMFWGLLLTKTKVNGKTLYVPRLKNGRKVSVLSQMRTLKAARLVKKLGTAGDKEFGMVNSAIIRLLAETPVKSQKARVHIQPVHVRYERSLSPLSPVYILQPR